MKKILLALPLMALLAAGCTSNEPGMGDNSTDKPIPNSGPGNYLSVRLVTAGGKGSRAQGYQDGEAYENKVNLVRFFFFDNSGEPALVKQNPSTEEFVSYYDWTPTDPSGSNPDSGQQDQTVEKILETTMLINGPEGAPAPNLIVAILNPTDGVLSMDNPTLQDLSNGVNEGIENFYTGLTNNNFVMSTSVYADDPESLGEDQTISYSVVDGHFADTLDESLENPVSIYVERVLARLDLSVTAPQAPGLDGVYDTEKTFQGEPVYVKFLGWQITSTPDKSRLVKSINPLWPSNLFGSDEPWNVPGYHRSFWAINPEYETEYTLNFFSYNNIVNNGIAMPTTGAYKTAYMQENAATYESGNTNTGAGPLYPTKVILAAQLVDEDGNEMEIAEWQHNQYTVQGLLNFFANNLNLYRKSGTTFTHIAPEDLEFISSYEFTGETGPDVTGQYYAYCVLTEDAEGYTWTEGNAQDATEFQSADAVNNYINIAYGPSMIWTNGYTYYFFDIRHLGATGSEGYYGVVRNHIYDAAIQEISGLGTPVFNPDEVIYPEVSERASGLIAAQIQILQWRIVSWKYSLTWN